MEFENVAFARHKLGGSSGIVERLYDNRQFGIDYGVGSRTNPMIAEREDEPTKPLERFNQIRKEGGLVVAKYRYLYGDDHFLLGIVEGDTNVTIHNLRKEDRKINALQMTCCVDAIPENDTRLFTDEFNPSNSAFHFLHEENAEIAREAYNQLW